MVRSTFALTRVTVRDFGSKAVAAGFSLRYGLTRRLKPAATTVRPRLITAALFIVAALAGCTSFGKFAGFSTKDSGPRPGLVQAMWLKQVHYLPDSTNNGAPVPALVGMVYFFPDEPIANFDDKTKAGGQSLGVDGTLVVDLYDDTPRTAGKEPKALERTTFPSDVLAKLKQRDPLLGIGYTVAVPWNTYSKDITKVHFQIRFEPKGGGAPLTANSSVISIDHGTPPAGVVTASAK